ncbi:MAG: fructose-1,6-bisphosphatase class 1 [Planctomycetota bacterium]
MPNSGDFKDRITTIERHFLDEQLAHPEAKGDLTSLLYDLALAGKMIASKTVQAGLADILGSTGAQNVQGETVQKLDVFADQTIYRLNDHTGRLACMGSEEQDEFIPIPEKYPKGNYVLLYDPLDGSSNIDVNVSVGTIFAIYKRKTPPGGPGTLEDCLQPGRNLVAAGYVIYGSSTMLVYTTGNGVHGFTLNRMLGEFLLSHSNIKMPAKPKYYSVNQAYEPYWSAGVLQYVRWLQTGENKLSLRYIGSLVADFHRNLLAGGTFCYPADRKDPKQPGGKLRLLYEAAPLAFIAEQAGGYATDGHRRILDIEPTSLHQRVPLFIGHKALTKPVEEYVQKYDK